MSSRFNRINPLDARITSMQVLIMVQLLEGHKYGYQIFRNLREDFNGVWNLKTGTIYPTLRSMTRKGQIAQSKTEEQTFYRLTEEGVTYLTEVGDFVNEFVLFGTHFIKSVLVRMPDAFVETLLTNVLASGINEVIPERVLVDELRRLCSADLYRSILENRRRALLDKLDLIEGSLNELQEGKV
jgi:DNA-binding PadR family transcriptional regulator